MAPIAAGQRPDKLRRNDRSFISVGRANGAKTGPHNGEAAPPKNEKWPKMVPDMRPDSGRTCCRTSCPAARPDGRTAAGQGTTPRRARSEKKSHQSPEVAPAHRFEGAAVFLRAGPAMKTARFGASFFEIKPVFLKQFLKVRGPDARAALKAAQTGYPF